MYQTTISSKQLQGEAFITKGKSRLKQNGSEVYLNDKDNFEIELFNPTTSPIIAKIKINGKLASESGLVIQPGQRYFLDRHINDSVKLVFNTYDVEDSKEVLEAINDNGSIIVEFYNEFKSNLVQYLVNNPIVTKNTYEVTCDSFSTGGANYLNIGNSSINGILRNSSFTNTSFNGTFGGSTTFTNMNATLGLPENTKSIETGRVGKGEESKQTFGKSNISFNSYMENMVSWVIKPTSTQPVEIKDLIVYCGGCGKKKTKKQDLFCSSCGNKF